MPVSATEPPQSRRHSRSSPFLVAVAAISIVVSACSDRTDLSASSPPADSVTATSTTSAPDSTTSTEPATTTSTTTTTTTLPPPTTVPVVTEGAVVLVANASGVPGAAGRLTQKIQGWGFHAIDPTNAAGNEVQIDVSKVYYTPAGQAVGTSLAHVLGDIPALPMPTPVPIVNANAGLGDATVLVMLGTDRAS